MILVRIIKLVAILIFTTSVSYAQEYRKRDFDKVIAPALLQGQRVELDLIQYCIQYPKNEEAKLKLKEVTPAYISDCYNNYMTGLLGSYESSGFNDNSILGASRDNYNFKLLEKFCTSYSQVFGVSPEVEVKIYELFPFEELRPNEVDIAYCSSFVKKVQTSNTELSKFLHELGSSISYSVYSKKWMEQSHKMIPEAIELLRKNEEPAVSQVIEQHNELHALGIIENGRLKGNFSIPKDWFFRDSISSLLFTQTSVFKENSNWTSDFDLIASECIKNACGPVELKVLNDFSYSLNALSESEFSESREATIKFILGRDFREWSKSVSNQTEWQLGKLYKSAVNQARTSVDNMIVLYKNQEKRDSWLETNSVTIKNPHGREIQVFFNANSFDESIKWKAGASGQFSDEGRVKLLSLDDFARGVMTYINREMHNVHSYSFTNPGGPEYANMSGKHSIPLAHNGAFDWSSVSLVRKSLSYNDKIITAGAYIDKSVGRDFMATYVLQIDTLTNTVDWVKFLDFREDELKHTYPQQLVIDNDGHLHVILSVYDICPDFAPACRRNLSKPHVQTKWLRMPLHIPEYGFDEVYENDQVFSDDVNINNVENASKLEGVKFIWSFGYEQGYLVYGLNPFGRPIFGTLYYGEWNRALTIPGRSATKTKSDFIVDQTQTNEDGSILIFGRYNRLHYNCGKGYNTIETQSQDYESSLNYFVAFVFSPLHEGIFTILPHHSYSGTPLGDVSGYKLLNEENQYLLPDGSSHPYPLYSSIECILEKLEFFGDNTDLYEAYGEFEH